MLIGVIILSSIAALFLMNRTKGTLWFSKAGLSQGEIIDRFVRQLNSEGIIGWLTLNAIGFDVRAILAICAWETGWLSDPKAKLRVNTKYNILGIDIYGRPGVGQTFLSYYACCASFERLIRTGARYASAYSVRDMGEPFIRALNLGGYNETQTWLTGVLRCYRMLQDKI